MIPRIIIWFVTGLAAFPVLVTAYGVFRIILISPYSRAEGVPWYYRFSDALVTTGNRLVIAGQEVPFYPRLWTTAVGLVGVVCLLVFVYFTFHRSAYPE